jgi:flagellar basal-body rod protein FlgB
LAMFPQVVSTMESAMKAAVLRHQVVAHNLANVNVPGYKAAAVSFEEELRAALTPKSGPATLRGRSIDGRHLQIGGEPSRPPVAPRVVLVAEGPMRQDGNNVDMESQMAQLAANQLWYQALTRSLTDEFSRLRTAIGGGK